MKLIVEKTDKLKGKITIPASKSHTIRGIIIASCSDGTSILNNPLYSDDTKAAITACIELGAKIIQDKDKLTITGFGRNPKTPVNKLEMLNQDKFFILIDGNIEIYCLIDGHGPYGNIIAQYCQDLIFKVI